MMTEALVHLVGTWPSWEWKTSKERLGKGNGIYILKMVEQKADVLAAECSKVDRKLFLNSIRIETEEGDDSRVNITDNKDSWAAVQMFQDWLATSLDEAEDDPIQRGAVYRTLHKGGEAYLPVWEVYEKMKELGVGFEHRELAEDMEALKELAKGIVKELCKNNVMLDVDRNKIQHLTCAEFEDEDMPWYGSDTTNIN